MIAHSLSEAQFSVRALATLPCWAAGSCFCSPSPDWWTCCSCWWCTPCRRATCRAGGRGSSPRSGTAVCWRPAGVCVRWGSPCSRCCCGGCCGRWGRPPWGPRSRCSSSARSAPPPRCRPFAPSRFPPSTSGILSETTERTSASAWDDHAATKSSATMTHTKHRKLLIM